MFNGRRQPSRGGTSRMTRECQVRFCGGLAVKFPGPTRHSPRSALSLILWQETDSIGSAGETHPATDARCGLPS
jgi:hypothetical protein